MERSIFKQSINDCVINRNHQRTKTIPVWRDGEVATIEVAVTTVSSNKIDAPSPANCWDDWKDEKERDQVLENAITYCGLAPKFDVHLGGSNSSVIHERVLKLRFTSGTTVSIRLDQGFAYWRFTGENGRKFPFTENIERQVEAVASLAGAIAAPTLIPTQIFVKIPK